MNEQNQRVSGISAPDGDKLPGATQLEIDLEVDCGGHRQTVHFTKERASSSIRINITQSCTSHHHVI